MKDFKAIKLATTVQTSIEIYDGILIVKTNTMISTNMCIIYIYTNTQIKAVYTSVTV